MSKRIFCAIAIAGLLTAGCGTKSADTLFDDTLNSLKAEMGLPAPNAGASRNLLSLSGESGFQGAQAVGTDSFVSARAPAISAGKTRSGDNGYTLNLVAAPIPVAAKSVLSDILRVNYSVDPRVEGTVTLQTSNPVSLIRSIAKAQQYYSAIKNGQTFEKIASSENLSKRRINCQPRIGRQRLSAIPGRQ